MWSRAARSAEANGLPAPSGGRRSSRVIRTPSGCKYYFALTTLQINRPPGRAVWPFVRHQRVGSLLCGLLLLERFDRFARAGDELLQSLDLSFRLFAIVVVLAFQRFQLGCSNLQLLQLVLQAAHVILQMAHTLLVFVQFLESFPLYLINLRNKEIHFVDLFLGGDVDVDDRRLRLRLCTAQRRGSR